MEDDGLLNGILLIAGGLTGLISLTLPPALWRDETDKLDMSAFKKNHPNKLGVYYLHKLLPYIWLLLYAFVIFPVIGSLMPLASRAIYFIGYFLVGGFGFLEGIVEIVTSVSSVHYKRGLIPHYLVYNKSVPRLGWLRLGFMGSLVLFAWLLIPLLFS